MYSERQPTLDRLDCVLPHAIGNVDGIYLLSLYRGKISIDYPAQDNYYYACHPTMCSVVLINDYNDRK